MARAGREVVLIGRAVHVEAIRCSGLRMQTQSFDERVPVSATTNAAAVAGAKLVLCCVKSNDTLQAAKDMAPYLEPDAIVLSLQNGYDNAERLQKSSVGLYIRPLYMSQAKWPAQDIYVITDAANWSLVNLPGVQRLSPNLHSLASLLASPTMWPVNSGQN